MVELYSPVVAEQLNYDGLFSMRELFGIIDKYFRTKLFDKKIIFDEEYHSEKGKYIHVKAEYYKKTDSYVRLQMRLWIYGNELVDVEKEVEGSKVRINHGKLNIIFDSFIQTEYFSLWPDDTAMGFLFRVLYEQYMMRSRIAYWEGVCRHIIHELRAEIAGYLNIHKFLYVK